MSSPINSESYYFFKPRKELEVWGREEIKDSYETIINFANAETSNIDEATEAIGVLAAYNELDELNAYFEEHCIDLSELYGSDKDAQKFVEQLLDTAEDEPVENFDAKALAKELNKAMKGWGLMKILSQEF